MGVGRKCRTLPGLEIHDIAADGAAPQRQSGLVGLAQKRQIDAKAAVGRLCARDRLKHQIDRHALPDQSERCRHMVRTQLWVGTCSLTMMSSSSRMSRQ